MDRKDLEIWFVTGSQDLYGEETLRQVAENSRCVVEGLNASGRLPFASSPRRSSPRRRRSSRFAAMPAAPQCAGVIAWMHTFSPAKMWIAGLAALAKPLAHLHTQFYRDLPWTTIDMDFMNLHQAAHGDREFGFLCTRLGKPRKVIVGHWQDPEVLQRVAAWMRAAAGVYEIRNLKVARLGDNMRQVAVTEGDKVEAQVRLGVEVNGYGVGELVRAIAEVSEPPVDRLCREYEEQYELDRRRCSDGPRRSALRYSARTELGLRRSSKRAVSGLYRHLRGPSRARAASRAGRAAADGRRLWLRRRGRLEDGGAGPGDEGHGPGLAGRDFVHGGLHLSSRSGRAPGARRPHAGDLPVVGCGKALLRDPSAWHRRQGRSGAAGLHGPGRPRGQCGDDRPGRSLPAVGQRGGRARSAPAASEAARGPGRLVAASGLQDRGRGMDLRRRSAPHGSQPGVDAEPLEDFAEMVGLECLAIDGRTQLDDFKNRLRWNQAAFSLGRG